MKRLIDRMRRRKLDSILGLISTVSVALMLKSSCDPIVSLLSGTWLEQALLQFETGNQIVFDVSVGIVVSIFFYVLVVRVPEAEKRRRLRTALRTQYQMLKKACIMNFLFACNGSADMSLVEKLTDRKEFKVYFDEAVSESQDRWHAVLNGLDEQRMQDILLELEVFRHEVEYVLSSVDVGSDEAFAFLKQLTQVLYRSKAWTHTYDHVKQLAQFMWAIHTGWSLIYGYTDRDAIAEMIEAV